MKHLFLLLGLFLFQSTGFAQNLVPRIEQYTTYDYGAGHQNWGIDQDEKGHIYVANQKGLLAFNGSEWSLHQLPEGTIIRSVKCIGDKIYVGSFKQFGYFQRDVSGNFDYHSLSNQLKDYPFQDEEFWQIVEYQNQIVFRSYSSIYFVNQEEKVTAIDIPGVPNHISILNNELFIFRVDNSLLKYENNELIEMSSPDELMTKSITESYVHKENKLIICNADFDCFEFNGLEFLTLNFPSIDFYNNNQLNKIRVLKNGDYFFGSIQKGILVTDSNGKKKFQINQSNGLSNNTVLDSKIDAEGNIWLALDYGVNFINSNSNNRFFIDETGSLGTVYAIQKHNNVLYIGSNKGLFYFENDNLKLVQGTNGQVWYLKEVNGDLFCGHNSGTYLIQNKQAKLISDRTGGWSLKAIPNLDNQFLQSNYNGFVKFNGFKDYENMKIGEFLSPIKNFYFLDNNTIIATHAYKGLFKIAFSDDFNSIENIENLMTKEIELEHNYKLLKIQNQIFLNTNLNWYRFDPVQNMFLIDKNITEKYTKGKHFELFNSNNNEIWLYKDNIVKEINTDSQEVKEYSFNNLTPQLINESEYVLNTGDNKGFYLNLINGFLHHTNDNNEKVSEIKELSIDQISNMGNTLIDKSTTKIEYKNNSIKINYSLPEYAESYQFQYILEPHEKDWTRSNSNSQTFENLKAGKYSFKVQAVYPNSKTTNIAEKSFKIKSPLYAKWYSYIFYALLFFGVFYYYRVIQKRKFIAKQKFLKEKYEEVEQERMKKEKMENEKRVAELNKEQLENAVDIKKKELANTTLSLVQKNELLKDLKSELLLANKEQPNIHTKKALKSIDQSLSRNENWKLFETQFNSVHREFLNKMSKEFPDLTKKDLKLCAYIKTGLTSKEIAPLMNISTRGVETHRYRLRKKLDLKTNKNMQDFITNYAV